MQTRIDFTADRHESIYRAMLGLSAAVRRSELEPSLLELVRLRVSQLNGCGYCIDMHTKDARAAGEIEQRLYLLAVWREAPLYTERERAALAWAEAVTQLERQQVPEESFAQARSVFSERELVALTLAIVEINGWNRFAISFGAVPGSYQPGQYADPRHTGEHA